MSDSIANVGERPTGFIADDMPGDFGVVVDGLLGCGFRQIVALDVQATRVRAVFSQPRPQPARIDIGIPGIAGFETRSQLKVNEGTRDIAMIFMTSMAGSEDMVEGFKTSGVDRLTTPVRVRARMARVETHLALRAMHRQLVAQSRQLLSEAAARQEAEAGLSRTRDELQQQVDQLKDQLAESNARLCAQIDERPGAEAKLKPSDPHLRTIIDSTGIPLCITSMPEGTILYANGPLRELFGLDARWGTLTSIVDFYVDACDRDRLLCQLRTGESFGNSEVRLRRPDGTAFWAMVTTRAEVFGDVPAIYVGLNDITARKRIEQELFESREQLRELSTHMEAIREEERKYIALEVHDELGQLLTALKMDISLLKMRLDDDPAAKRKADEMCELVERTIWLVRNVANHLRPAALNFGIVSALEWLVEDFGRRNSIPCKLHVNGGEPALEDACATAVFRIVQAALTNVGRHANATRVDVTLTSTSAILDLHVCDDGCGFDPGKARRGNSYGLLGMQERARMLGGGMTVDSTPGTGAAISVHIPIIDGVNSGQAPDR